ncbi:MAG: hypothetical protein ABIA66_03680, partial [Candidatus Omnitrophota bacterium]
MADDNLAEDQATNEDDLDDADGLSDDINDELTLDFKADEESEKKEKKEKDKSKDDDIIKEVDTLKSELEQLKEDKKNLNKALHSLRQEKKKDSVKADTGRLSEAQLKQIIEDNPEDTETQFRVLRYLAEEYSKGASKEAVNAAEISRTKTKLDDYLNEQYPEITEDGSDMRREVEEAKTGLALENHPFGDYLAVAARVLDAVPNLMKDAFEKGKAQGLGQKA